MDALAIATAVIGLLTTAAKAAPVILDGIENGKPFAVALWKQLTGQEPSDEDAAAIDTALAKLSAKLEAPLPPAEPGDPDYTK